MELMDYHSSFDLTFASVILLSFWLRDGGGGEEFLSIVQIR